MNKPLKDWTLGEIKAECVKRNAFCEANGKCPFFVPENKEFRCGIRYNIRNTFPGAWDLSEPPCWTEQDREDAKAIKAILLKTSSVTIARLPGGTVKLSESDRCVFLDLNRNLFPSLKPGKSATIDEIIGGAE